MTHSIGRSYRRSATDAVEAGLFPYDESGDSLDSNPSIPSSIIDILIGVFGGQIPPNILDEDLSQSLSLTLQSNIEMVRGTIK